jgi:hypothetical protein
MIDCVFRFMHRPRRVAWETTELVASCTTLVRLLWRERTGLGWKPGFAGHLATATLRAIYEVQLRVPRLAVHKTNTLADPSIAACLPDTDSTWSLPANLASDTDRAKP